MSPDPSNWILAAFLLLLGANMVVAPGNLNRFSEGLSFGIRNFERHMLFRDPMWRYRWHRQLRGLGHPVSTRSIRVAGMVLIGFGYLTAFSRF